MRAGRTPARVKLLPDPEVGAMSVSGPIHTAQEAVVELPRELLEELWRPSFLERLARAYWSYLQKVSLGLIRVVYEPGARTVVLASKRIPLLRFRRPEYVTLSGLGRVTWRIERGVLVAGAGRGQGFLRITVRRLTDDDEAPEQRLLIRAEVANFYPVLRGAGAFARIGLRLYAATQMRIHVWVTHGFLRSLARLELPPSPVGALAQPNEIAQA